MPENEESGITPDGKARPVSPPYGGNTTGKRNYNVARVRGPDGTLTDRTIGAPLTTPETREAAPTLPTVRPPAAIVTPAAATPEGIPQISVTFKFPGIGDFPSAYEALLFAGGWLIFVGNTDGRNFRPYAGGPSAPGGTAPRLILEVDATSERYNLFADPPPFGYDYAGRRYYCVRAFQELPGVIEAVDPPEVDDFLHNPPLEDLGVPGSDSFDVFGSP